MLRHYLYAVLMWTICIYAIRRGGWPERSVGSIIAIGGLLSATVAGDYRALETGILFIDVIMFLALFAIGLLSDKYWTLWIAALQGVSLLGHLLPLMPLWNRTVYNDAIALWSWPMLLILGLATWKRHVPAMAGGSSFG
jgi:hypothetical protein